MLRFNTSARVGKRLIGRRGFSLLARGRRPIRVSYLLPRVLVFVTVETQQFPVAPIGWIVVVVMVPVMDRKLAKLLAAEFATAPRTDPGIYLERLLPIGIGPLIAVALCLDNNRVPGCRSLLGSSLMTCAPPRSACSVLGRVDGWTMLRADAHAAFADLGGDVVMAEGGAGL